MTDGRADDMSAPESESETGFIYFSFGSNMSREKLQNRKILNANKISFSDIWVGRARGWRLCFNQPIMPPVDPVMASLERCDNHDAYGVVYRLSCKRDWEALCATEGVWDAHSVYTVIQLRVQCFERGCNNGDDDVVTRTAYTFVTRPRYEVADWRGHHLYPSERYMGLIIAGAQRENLPDAYVRQLEAIPTARAWKPCLLTRIMPFIAPLMMMMAVPGSFYWRWPIVVLVMHLYSVHERRVAARTDDENRHGGSHTRGLFARVWDAICITGAYYGMVAVFLVYLLPSLGFLAFSKDARCAYRFVSVLFHQTLAKGTDSGTDARTGARVARPTVSTSLD